MEPSGAPSTSIDLADPALVFDHFHIIKMACGEIYEIRRGLQRTLELGGLRFIEAHVAFCSTARRNLTEDKRPNWAEALAYNEPLSKA